MEPKKRRVVAGSYEVGSVIGIGSFGEVRHAKHIKTDKNVALKIVDLSRFREDTAAIIVKEIKILRILDHPNIVGVHEVNEKVPYRGSWCDNCACTSFVRLSNGSCGNCGHSGFDHAPEEVRPVMLIAQELAVGGELFGLLMHCGKFEPEVARYYFRQLIAGIEYMHSKDVIHRDLKPENLVLDENFRLKIVDFGLAALNPESSEEMDSAQSASGNYLMHSGVGSQAYTAPEVFYTKELYSGGYKGRPADVWSCGVILFCSFDWKTTLCTSIGENVRTKSC
jgi:5'-AMP-activated protein kinase catalytic alpha subunit